MPRPPETTPQAVPPPRGPAPLRPRPFEAPPPGRSPPRPRPPAGDTSALRGGREAEAGGLAPGAASSRGRTEEVGGIGHSSDPDLGPGRRQNTVARL
ncbi:hypothetical protein VULLAG_LOCUS21553 [Vulpes lagopus]